jgi:hypothetical protein
MFDITPVSIPPSLSQFQSIGPVPAPIAVELFGQEKRVLSVPSPIPAGSL